MSLSQSDKLLQLHKQARAIFDAALRSVDPDHLVRQAVKIKPSGIRIVDTVLDKNKPIYVVSIGKAALGMARALNASFRDHISEGVVSCNAQDITDLPPFWHSFSGGHPLPNQESLDAALATFQLLERAEAEKAAVVFAISGGGSAMLEWPISKEISLNDLQQANRILISSGATIAEINSVRRAFSAVKGGKLLRYVSSTQTVTLIISDTNPGDEASVASGPSLIPPPGLPKARDVIRKYGLESHLPKSIIRVVKDATEDDTTAKSDRPAYVLADNNTALQAAAAKALSFGFTPILATDVSEQAVERGSHELIQRLRRGPSPVCLVSGGEFSCPVRGDGLGGRNLETVLRCAIGIDSAEHEEHLVVLSAGTDGIDGNSPAAGAIADETTLTRGLKLGVSAEKYLARSDSYSFFQKLGDVIITGPTGTNVRDVRILLKASI